MYCYYAEWGSERGVCENQHAHLVWIKSPWFSFRKQNNSSSSRTLVDSQGEGQGWDSNATVDSSITFSPTLKNNVRVIASLAWRISKWNRKPGLPFNIGADAFIPQNLVWDSELRACREEVLVCNACPHRQMCEDPNTCQHIPFGFTESVFSKCEHTLPQTGSEVVTKECFACRCPN